MNYLKDRKSIFSLIALSFAFILTILLSVGVNFVLQGLTPSFWGDLAISFSLLIYTMFLAIPEGKEFYMKKPDGRYIQAFGGFIKIREKNKDKDNAFNQWLEVYFQKEKLSYYEAILSLQGNINSQVLDLDKEELDNLLKPYKKEWNDTEFAGREPTYFRSITEEQLKVVKAIFNGEVTYEKLPNDYFKTLNGKVIMSEYQQQAEIDKTNTRKMAVLILYRIMMLFAFAFAFALFGFEVIKAVDSNEQWARVIKLISRVWTMLSALTYGFALGKHQALNETEKLEFKTRVNETFNLDNSFIPLSESEIAKKEYEEAL